MTESCNICGAHRNLDRHHVIARGMGGTKDQAVHDEANLMTLCRSCHRNLHEGRWKLVRTPDEIRVFDTESGEEVMRRFTNGSVDASSLFQILNLAESSLSALHQALPYLTDEQLVEAFGYAKSFGKRSWLIQAAILYEAQKRSTYGEQALVAIARRFEIGLRHAQKYALVWRVFFSGESNQEFVNIDAILLDEPSWYVIAVSETNEPEKWLAYAQDRKTEDPRFSVFVFRRDIRLARLAFAVDEAKSAQNGSDELPTLNGWGCPWVRLLCVRSGKPTPYGECPGCEFLTQSEIGIDEHEKERG